ncbi:hypothetical protein GQX74_015210 [Glossina fuscipes]|nr:hypothetical protein GQX74_015210 [Glossina fuscipes]
MLKRGEYLETWRSVSGVSAEYGCISINIHGVLFRNFLTSLSPWCLFKIRSTADLANTWIISIFNTVPAKEGTRSPKSFDSSSSPVWATFVLFSSMVGDFVVKRLVELWPSCPSILTVTFSFVFIIPLSLAINASISFFLKLIKALGVFVIVAAGTAYKKVFCFININDGNSMGNVQCVVTSRLSKTSSSLLALNVKLSASHPRQPMQRGFALKNSSGNFNSLANFSFSSLILKALAGGFLFKPYRLISTTTPTTTTINCQADGMVDR